MLTKRWAPTLLSKLSENYAVVGKWIKYYVDFGVHGPLKCACNFKEVCSLYC